MYIYMYIHDLLVIASMFILCGGRHGISQACWPCRQVSIFDMIGDGFYGKDIASRALQLAFDFGLGGQAGPPDQHVSRQVADHAPL